MPDLPLANRSTLIDDLTPSIVATIQANREDIIAAAGGAIQEFELRAVWPKAIKILPAVLTHAYVAILTELKSMSVGDLGTRITGDLQTLKARESL